MAKTVKKSAAGSFCALCPGACELGVEPSGPDLWRTEFPTTNSGGLCARGSALGQLASHHGRILYPAQKVGGKLISADLDGVVKHVLKAGESFTVLVDGNLPVEQLLSCAAWCKSWHGSRLCLVVEPSDEQLLLGILACGADIISNKTLAECDGFLIVGDAFQANPTCARPVFDVRAKTPRVPIVTIDSAAGTPTNFASHIIETKPGMEFESVLALARQGPAIFLGRAADLILPHDRGLRVRLLAPEETRVSEHARQGGCDEDAARTSIGTVEQERTDFIRHHFTRTDLVA